MKTVSIPKRVLEALNQCHPSALEIQKIVSIPKRVLEALNRVSEFLVIPRELFQSLKGFWRL